MKSKQIGLLLLGGVALYYFYGKRTRVYGFADGAGVPVDTIKCGNPLNFDVPGYDAIWLRQTQNGQLQYEGPFTVPMQQYSLLCASDIGTFAATMYELVDGQKGQLIGTDSVVVIP